jgi:hypothetical protein
MDEERAIEQFLGDRPRADDLARMRQTLLDRRRRLAAEREDAGPEARAALQSRMAALDQQIAALEQEELITRFVEDSVRVTLTMGSVVDGDAEA